MSDDHSPGDGRKPYSDSGGREAKHAETHDVRREQLTNPTGPEPEDTSFAEQMEGSTPESIREEAAENVVSGDALKDLRSDMPELSGDELSRLSVIQPGTVLPQGSVFLDLNDRSRGAFKAIGGQEVGQGERIVAKSDTDYELWNRLAGRDDEPEIERPEGQ